MKSETLPAIEALPHDQQKQLHMVALEELRAANEPAAPTIGNERLGMFTSVKAKVSAIVGQADATVGELMSLKVGEVIALDRDVDMPIDLWVEGRLIGRGHLSVVGDKFAVLVTQVITSVDG